MVHALARKSSVLRLSEGNGLNEISKDAVFVGIDKAGRIVDLTMLEKSGSGSASSVNGNSQR